MNAVIQHVREVVHGPRVAEGTDASLLEAFIDHHNEAAFETLVRRHGAMVLGVCRRILHSHHDAEDAFQATFLVLVRKAASVSPREMVGNWLYGVAYQTALKARAIARRRQAKERPVAEITEPEVVESTDLLWQELRPLIDQEVSRLPQKYRAPLVLCDLEELTRKEAAEQLGWPEGTVSGRLSRARAMLANRLNRRGVTLPGVVLGVILAQNAASASVPLALLVPTVNAGSLVAAGHTAGIITTDVAAITQGVLRSMMFTKLKIAVSVLTVGLVVSGVGFAIASAVGQAPGQKQAVPANNGNGQKNNGIPGAKQPNAKQPVPKFFGFKLPGQNGKNEGNGNNNQNGNNEQNGNNNQNGNDEPNGQNNQNGNDEKNGNNNQNGNNQKNGQNAKQPIPNFLGFKIQPFQHDSFASLRRRAVE